MPLWQQTNNVSLAYKCKCQIHFFPFEVHNPKGPGQSPGENNIEVKYHHCPQEITLVAILINHGHSLSV